MLSHPTLDKLRDLKLFGMLQALDEQTTMPDRASLTFEERLGLLVDREITQRDQRLLQRRLAAAHLRQQAVLEDIDWRAARGLDKSLIRQLAGGQWIAEHRNLLVTGPTGVGKSWLACALAHAACRLGHRALYQRLPRLLGQLAVAQADGRYEKVLAQLARIDLLVLDDWGLDTLTSPERRHLLELLEDRYERRSTLVTSQLPSDRWHEWIGDATRADAILDRLVHNAYRIPLKGESMRKQKTKLPPEGIEGLTNTPKTD